MFNILNYIYQTWRTAEFGYFGIGIGILVGLILVIGIIITLRNNGRNDI